MKKLVIIFFIILSCMLMFSSAFIYADEEKVTSKELTQEWVQTNIYPDDVCGVYYSDKEESFGKLTIMIFNLTQEREDEIRNMVSDPEKLYFENGKYKRQELFRVQGKIGMELSTEDGIYSVAVRDTYNRVEVLVDKRVFEEKSLEYEKRFGDMVYVEAGGPVVALSNDQFSDTPDVINEITAEPMNLNAIILIALSSFVVLTSVVFFSIKKRKTALQTTGGTVVSKSIIGKRKLIDNIKRIYYVPEAESFNTIMYQILDKRGDGKER